METRHNAEYETELACQYGRDQLAFDDRCTKARLTRPVGKTPYVPKSRLNTTWDFAGGIFSRMRTQISVAEIRNLLPTVAWRYQGVWHICYIFYFEHITYLRIKEVYLTEELFSEYSPGGWSKPLSPYFEQAGDKFVLGEWTQESFLLPEFR